MDMEHLDKPITRFLSLSIEWAAGLVRSWHVSDLHSHHKALSLVTSIVIQLSLKIEILQKHDGIVEEDKSVLELYQKMKSKQKLLTWTLKNPKAINLRIQKLIFRRYRQIYLYTIEELLLDLHFIYIFFCQ